MPNLANPFISTLVHCDGESPLLSLFHQLFLVYLVQRPSRIVEIQQIQFLIDARRMPTPSRLRVFSQPDVL